MMTPDNSRKIHRSLTLIIDVVRANPDHLPVSGLLRKIRRWQLISDVKLQSHLVHSFSPHQSLSISPRLSQLPLISLLGITSLLLCAPSFATIPQQIPVTIAQEVTNSNQAQQVFQEGLQLYQQATAESLRQAIPKFEQAVILYRQAGDKHFEAVSLLTLGRVYDDLGEKQKALTFYNQALPLFREVGDRGWQATTLNNIGAFYDSLGEKQKALAFYNQALPIFQAVGDRRMEATTLNNIGYVYDSLGEKQKALAFYNQALPIFQAVGDRRGEATTLNNIGNVYNSLGEKQKALAFYNQALPILQAVGDRRVEATTLNNIGAVYSSLGEKQKALAFYNQALPLFQAVGDRRVEATTLNNIGRVYDSLGEKQKALNFYNQALPIFQAVGDRRGEATTLNNIGYVYDSLGEKQKALNFYNQALPIFQAVGDRRGEATTLNNIGYVYDSLGEKQKALDFYNQALPISQAVGDRDGEATTLNNLAFLQRSQGNLKEALTLMDSAITIIEDLRTKIGSQELRASYFATVQDYYEFYINLLMELHQQNPTQGYNILALNASERARARSLLELLTEANANIREGVEPKLLEEEQRLQQQLNSLDSQKYQLLSSQYTQAQVDEIKQKIDNTITQFNQLKAQIRTTSPRYANLKYPQPLNLQQIQQQVLDDDTILLEYSLGEERSYLWVVTKNSINSYVLPKRSEIEAAAQTFRESLTNSGAKLETGIPLSQILLAPVANQLGNKRLLIVGDGVLQYIPFAALPIPTSPPAPLLQGEGSKTSTSLLAGEGSKTATSLLQGEVSKTPTSPLQGEGSKTATSPLQGEGSKTPTSLLQGEGNSSPPFPSREGGLGGLGFSPLLVQNEIVTLPSASTVAIQRQQLQNRTPATKTLAVLADPVFNINDDRFSGNSPQKTPKTPDNEALNRAARNLGIGENAALFSRLEFTRREAEKILALIPDTQELEALDFNASRTQATNPNLSQYQIVHFATHGLLDSKNPELSGIVLSLFNEKRESQDGFLRLHDIFNLNLPAELVVLSACQTGLGENVKGEGIVGLTRGFMYAGARRVVVSLWSVNDSGTSELMVKFYQKMLEGGQNPVKALREAQLEMWNSGQWQSPYYWAAFTVQGDWR